MTGPEKSKDILFADAPFKIRARQIALDRADRSGVFLDEQYRGRAPAERFDSQGAASREQIEHARADYFLAKTGEDRALHPIHRRADAAFGNIQLDTARQTGDHSHGDGVGDGDGAAAAGSFAGFFFLSDFPPPIKPVMTLLRFFRSRPISLSIRFVFGRPTVPLT